MALVTKARELIFKNLLHEIRRQCVKQICERVKKRPHSNNSQLPPVLNKLKTAAPARSPSFFTCRLRHPCSNNPTGLFPNQIAITSPEGRGLGPIHTMRHVSVPSPFHLRSVRMICVHAVRRVPSRSPHDRRPVIISIKYAAHCHAMHFPLFINY